MTAHPARAVAAWLWDHLTHRKPPPPPAPPRPASSLQPRWEDQFTHRTPPSTP